MRIEPIALSGECITVAVAIQTEDKPRVISALSEEVTTAVFGEHGASLLGIARMASDSIYQHLLTGRDFDTWIPPLGGISLGDVEEGQGESIDEIAKQALRASACFSAMTEGFQAKATRERNSLLTKMQSIMKRMDLQLADNFGVDVPVTIRGATMKIRCDYFSSRLAINLCSLAPGRNLNAQFEAFNTRLCRLDQLKANEALDINHQEPRIIMAIPSEEALELSAHQGNVHTFRDRLLMAQDIASRHRFDLTTVLSAEVGTKLIIKRERHTAH